MRKLAFILTGIILGLALPPAPGLAQVLRTEQVVPAANPPALLKTGSLSAAGDVVDLPVANSNTGAVQLVFPAGAAGTVYFAASIDGGTTYFPQNALPLSAAGGGATSSVTASGQWEMALGAITNIRAYLTSAASGGPIAVTLGATNGAKSIRATTPPGNVLSSALYVGTNPNSSGNPLFASITNLPSVQAITATQLPASLGQKSATNSLSVVLASDQGSVLVADGADPASPAVANAGTGSRGWLSTLAGQLGGSLKVVLQAGTNTVGAVTQAGTWAVNATLQTGSAIIGKVGIDQTTPGTTNGVVVNSGTVAVGSPTVIADASGTITTANAFQTTAPASPTRTFLLLSNPDTSTPLAFRISGGAGLNAAGSITLAPGQTITFDSRVPTGIVTVVGGTAGKPFTVIYTN